MVIWLAGLLALSIATATAQDAGWQKAEPPLRTRWYDEVSPENALPEYPRPQMVREEWLNLNGLWEFEAAAEGDAPPFGRTLDEQILVPFPVESALSGLMRHEDRMWYRRTFEVPADWTGEHLLLHFGAVDWQATVYVNGAELGTHNGGYDGFSFDITDSLKTGAQEIIVGVYDPTDSEGQPRGKQVLQPGGIFYTANSGIWQTVWLEPVAPTSIDNLHMTPDIDAGVLKLTVTPAGESAANLRVEAEAFAESESVATMAGAADVELMLEIPNAHLWSPDDPFLYDLRVTLYDGDTQLDEVTSYFGMRKISLGVINYAPRILLNNEHVFQIGPLDQGYFPDGLYTAPTDDALRADIEFAKSLGWNMIRKHVKVEPERWYYWADRLGLLVWQDMPSGDSNNLLTYPEAEFQAELGALVEGRRNHPSVVIWVIFNEGWGQAQYGSGGNVRLVNFVKELDPSRLVINASGWNDFGLGDIHDIHTYVGPEAPMPERYRAGVQGEFGGLGLHTSGHEWGAEDYAYEWQPTSERLVARYTGLISQVSELMKNVGLSAAVYTELTDIEGELNGFITYDREVVKVDIDAVYIANRALIDQSLLIQSAP